jgi:hypothetical protein
MFGLAHHSTRTTPAFQRLIGKISEYASGLAGLFMQFFGLRQFVLPPWCEITGAWKQNCTGRWMSILEKMTVGYGLPMPPKICRGIALTLLKQEKTAKMGIIGKRMKAAYDRNYLIKLLQF